MANQPLSDLIVQEREAAPAPVPTGLLNPADFFKELNARTQNFFNNNIDPLAPRRQVEQEGVTDVKTREEAASNIGNIVLLGAFAVAAIMVFSGSRKG